MASNRPVAVQDACVLYPFRLCNVTIRRAFGGFVEVHAQVERLEAARDRMNAVLPEAGVVDYRPLIADLALPDPVDLQADAVTIDASAWRSVVCAMNAVEPALRADHLSNAQPLEVLRLKRTDVAGD